MYVYLYNLVITVHSMYKIQLQFHVMICCLLCVNLQVWANKSQLPGDHVTAGSFETAMRVSQCCRRHAVYVLYIHVHVGRVDHSVGVVTSLSAHFTASC